MTLEDLWKYDATASSDRLPVALKKPFGYLATCSAPHMTFEDWLRIQEGDDEIGQFFTWFMNFDGFFERAEKLTDGVTTADQEVVLMYLDPESTQDPYFDFCFFSSLMVNPRLYPNTRFSRDW